RRGHPRALWRVPVRRVLPEPPDARALSVRLADVGSDVDPEAVRSQHAGCSLLRPRERRAATRAGRRDHPGQRRRALHPRQRERALEDRSRSGMPLGRAMISSQRILASRTSWVLLLGGSLTFGCDAGETSPPPGSGTSTGGTSGGSGPGGAGGSGGTTGGAAAGGGGGTTSGGAAGGGAAGSGGTAGGGAANGGTDPGSTGGTGGDGGTAGSNGGTAGGAGEGGTAGTAGNGGEAGADHSWDGCEEFIMPADCTIPQGAVLPGELRCTGLYSNWEERKLRCGVRPYKPAHELWSDAAGKQRYVWLPPGKTIDVSNPDEWDYPVGTRFWKEFYVGPEGN